MEYIKICNWEKFQHYKKRNPPWIKIHTQLLENEQFECLHNDSKVLLICLWLFTARKGNGQIPADPNYLQRKLPIGKKPNLQPLINTGFIECLQDDSKVIAIDDSKVLALDRGETEERQSRDRGKFTPPSLEEVKKYIQENKYDVDAVRFIKYYAAADWHDQNGKPVRNWKQKLIAVWANREKKPNPQKCVKCSKIGVYAEKDDTGQVYWLCEDHKLKRKPLEGIPQPQMKTADEKPINFNERRNKNRRALGV